MTQQPWMSENMWQETIKIIVVWTVGFIHTKTNNLIQMTIYHQKRIHGKPLEQITFVRYDSNDFVHVDNNLKPQESSDISSIIVSDTTSVNTHNSPNCPFIYKFHIWAWNDNETKVRKKKSKNRNQSQFLRSLILLIISTLISILRKIFSVGQI